MGKESSIQWTDVTWNVARGCHKVDADCRYCYMYRDSFDSTRYNPLQVVRTKTVFNLPLKIKEPSKIFTCSLTDFFHEAIDSYRDEAWDIIRRCPQHTFQILTKRPERINSHLPKYWDEIRSRVWMGTSVGSGESIHRAYQLIDSDADLHFLSLEPMYGEIDLMAGAGLSIKLIECLDWVIVGGESGNEIGKYRYRPCKIEWIEKIVSQCKNTNTPVFVKQLGTHLAKEMKLSDKHGGNILDFPKHLQVRQFPNML